MARRFAVVLAVAALVCVAGCKGKDKDSGKAKPKPKPKVTPKPKPSASVEYWKLTASPQPGMDVLIALTLTKGKDGAWSGSFDIPMQQVKGIPVKDIKRTPTSLELSLPPAAKLVVTLDKTGKKGTGTLGAAGGKQTITAERVPSKDKLPTLRRPQTPKGPFPYAERKVIYDNTHDKSKLAGTLTLPKKGGPHPAVVLISGSGAQDRDSTIFGHKPFLVIADALTRAGVAVLRVDDRGTGQTTGKAAEGTVEIHAKDAMSSVAFLRTQKDIDPKRIGLIGHSEGGMIAPLVAAEDRKIAFVVSLAGAGLPGSEIIPVQLGVMLRQSKVSDKVVAQLVKHQRAVIKAVIAKADKKTLHKLVKAGIVKSRKLAPQLDPMKRSDADLDAAATMSMRALESPWFRSFVMMDPRKVWPKVRCPVLALNGGLDTQVPAASNLKAIADALAKGGNKNVKTESLPGLNHLFQKAKTGLVNEYALIEQTIDTTALKHIVTWIQGQVLGSK